jgi:hypothetical protein
MGSNPATELLFGLGASGEAASICPILCEVCPMLVAEPDVCPTLVIVEPDEAPGKVCPKSVVEALARMVWVEEVSHCGAGLHFPWQPFCC